MGRRYEEISEVDGRMTLGSLFDGSGAFPFAGVMCGIEPKWASEIEKFPIEVTKKRFPNMKHLGDVCGVDGSKIEPADVITFSSPCQDLSIAGQRAGLNDGERSNLFYEAIRIIKEMRGATNGRYPTFAVWENVVGAFTSNEGKDFQDVLQALVGVADGRAFVPRPTGGGWRDDGLIMGDNYSVAWRVLSAEYWGVPQKRRRIFAVADFRGQRAGKILFEREGLQRDFATVKGAWGRIDTDSEVGVRVAGKHFKRQGGVVPVENHPADSRIREQSDDVCQTLTSRMGTGGNNVPMVAEDVMFFDRAMFNQGTNAKYSPVVETDGKTTTIVARGPGGVAYTIKPQDQDGTGGGTNEKDVTYSLHTRWYGFPVTEEKTLTMEATDYKTPQNVVYREKRNGHKE